MTTVSICGSVLPRPETVLTLPVFAPVGMMKGRDAVVTNPDCEPVGGPSGAVVL